MDQNRLENNICPICLYIFIQPVTMPCKHELCLSCFKQNVEEANFCCPMCRMRISTWARRAARNNSLVNQKRWEQIQLKFPSQVHSRLEGLEEEDEEMNALNISIKLAEPGEIRSEFEEQLKKLQDQRVEERRKELEASERLIKQLQAEEMKKREEMERLEKQDMELAKALSQKDAASPIDQRTRSALSTQSDDEMDNNMEAFLDKMRTEHNRTKSPYPYTCLSPLPSGEGKLCVDKDKVKQMEKNFQQQKLKKDRSLVTTQDIAILEEQFKLNALKTATEGIEIDCLRKATGSATSLTATMTKVVSSSNLNQEEILNQMSDMDITLKAVENDDDPEVIVIPSRGSSALSTHSSTREDNSTPKSKSRHVSERSTSAQSTDSISVELSHFRPIRSCPLTPPRVLPSGKVVEPQLIRTTPRNLSKTGFGSPVETNLSDIDAGSPIMKRRLSELAEERKDQVLRFSKSTSTGSSTADDENRNPDDVASPLLTRSLRSNSSSRGEEFKDISNSPFQKRKFDFNEEEIDASPAKKKLILSLDPNLDESTVSVPDPLEMLKVNPTKCDGDLTPGKRSRLSKVKHAKSARVRYSVDETSTRSPQSSIMQWVTKGENSQVCLNNHNALGRFMPLSRDEVDRESKNRHRNKNCTKTAGTLDLFLSQNSSSDNNSVSRAKRSRRTLRQSDYIYADDEKECKVSVNQCSDTSPGKISPISLGDSDTSNDAFIPSKIKVEKSDGSYEPISYDEPSKVQVKVEKSDGSYEPISYCEHSSSHSPRRKRSRSDDVIFVNFKHASSSTNHRLSGKVNSKTKVKCKSTKTMPDFFSPKSGKPSDDSFSDIIDQEEKDRLLALELQKQFELEAKFKLTAQRFKGTNNEYSLRRNLKTKVPSDS